MMALSADTSDRIFVTSLDDSGDAGADGATISTTGSSGGGAGDGDFTTIGAAKMTGCDVSCEQRISWQLNRCS